MTFACLFPRFSLYSSHVAVSTWHARDLLIAESKTNSFLSSFKKGAKFQVTLRNFLKAPKAGKHR
jgi:hypothetical protein